jgi:tetratricopeptide (TPR) repeat protein
VERRGDEVVRRALAWLQEGGPTPLQFFLWVHVFEPHDPYDPPGDLRAKFASAPYDGEIAAVDRLVGRLVSAVAPDTLVVVAADHGEALGDHGEATHGVFLYDETLHVPLVMRFPDGRGAGVRVPTRVRLTDVAPTLLQAIGAAVPAEIEGQSLLPFIAPAAKMEDRPVYAESTYPRQAFGWSPLVAWRADRFLYVRAPTRELYDLVADPAAARNIADARSRVADGMDAELTAFLGRTAIEGARAFQASGKPGAARIDPEVAERLAALGYVSGSGGSPAGNGIDPKDRIAIANALHEAIVAVEDGAFARAVPLLEKVTASEPAIPIAQLNLGVARARQRQYAGAVVALTRAVALQPDDMRGHYELGSALYETGDLKSAAAQFAIVAAKMPAWADARYSLGSVYARIDRVADAVTELKAAIAREPRHFRANLLLGRILTLRGEKAAAIPYLQTAVAVQPDSSEAKQFLADALKKDDNRRER